MTVGMIAGFDWDEGNREKCQKHGVPHDTIEDLFARTIGVFPDPTPGETRFRAVGKSQEGRAVFLVFTLRERNGEVFIRPISARYMHQREVESYEKANPDV